MGKLNLLLKLLVKLHHKFAEHWKIKLSIGYAISILLKYSRDIGQKRR